MKSIKGFKLSKISWLILAAGTFLVVLAGLGLTRSQQMGDQKMVQEELDVSKLLLEKIDISELQYIVNDLEVEIQEEEANLADALSRLQQTIISVDVVEEFYRVAELNDMAIMELSTRPIDLSDIDETPLFLTYLSSRVIGTLGDTIDFIENLNATFITGYIETARLQVGPIAEEDEDIDASTSTVISMMVYTNEVVQ